MGSKKQKIAKHDAAQRKRDEGQAIDFDAVVNRDARAMRALRHALDEAGVHEGFVTALRVGTMPAALAEGFRAALARAGKETKGRPRRASQGTTRGQEDAPKEALRDAPREPDPALLRKPSWMRQGVLVRVVAAGARKGKVGTVEGDLADGYVSVDFGKHSLNRMAFYPGELAREEDK